MAISATSEALRLLQEERERLDRAIAELESGGRELPRRDRPARGTNGMPASAKRRGRPTMTPEERWAASERMKKYWAQRRKAAKAAKKRETA